MREYNLVAQIRKHIKARWPKAFVSKLSDRNTRGVPDMLIIVQGHWLLVEAKVGKNVASPIQRAIMAEIMNAGGQAMTVRSAKEVEDYFITVLK